MYKIVTSENNQMLNMTWNRLYHMSTVFNSNGFLFSISFGPKTCIKKKLKYLQNSNTEIYDNMISMFKNNLWNLNANTIKFNTMNKKTYFNYEDISKADSERGKRWRHHRPVLYSLVTMIIHQVVIPVHYPVYVLHF